MAKVTVVPLGSMENQTTFVQTLNANFEAIAAALETFLSRDGTTPNQLTAALDMNSQRILNLPSPIDSSDPARLIDLQDIAGVDVLVIPSLTGQSGKLFSNDGTVLTLVAPGDVPGFGDLVSTENLADLASATTARTNLGLGTSATYNIGTSGTNIPTLDGANTWSGAQTFSAGFTAAGATTFSGTGDHRLTATSTALTPESIGFRGTPASVQDTNYTFVLDDAGRTKLHTSGTGHSYTIPPSSSVDFPTGTILVGLNSGTGSIVLTKGSGVTFRRIGTGTDANVTVAQWGVFSALKTSTDTWAIDGTNLS